MNDETLFDPDAADVPIAPPPPDAAARMDDARRVAEEHRAQQRASIRAGLEGQAKARRGADPAWLDAAYDAVLRTAELLAYFTSDDVWEFGGLERTEENRALGPVMTRARRNGIIERTDTVLTTRARASHGSPARLWRSLIHRET